MNSRLFGLGSAVTVFLLAASTIAGPIVDPGPFSPINSPYRPWEVGSFGTYTARDATIKTFAVISHVPAKVKGLVYFFHGAGGSADIVDRLEATVVLDELIDRGYAFVSTESETRPDGIIPGPIGWFKEQQDSASIAEFKRLRDLRADLISRFPQITEQTSIFPIGFSDGGRKALVFGEDGRAHGWNVPAVAAMAPDIMPETPESRVRLPTFIQALENDKPPSSGAPGVGPDRVANALGFHNILFSEGVPSEFHLGEEKILDPNRFNRILAVQLGGFAQAIFDALVAGDPANSIPGLIDAAGNRLFPSDVSEEFLNDLLDTSAGSPGAVFNVIDGHLDTGAIFTTQEVGRQVKVAWGLHQVSGEFSIELADFFDTQLAHTVPEPGTFILFSLGLFGLGVARRRKRCAA